MKILIICPSFLEETTFGKSRFNQMAEQWALKGHDVTVITSGSGNQKKKEVLNLGKGKIRVLRCRIPKKYNKSFLWRFFSYLSLALKSMFIGVFYSGKQDIVIVSSPPLHLAASGYIVSRAKKIPMVLEVRDLWPKFIIDIGVLKNKHVIKAALFLERFAYKKSKRIVVLSPAYEDYLNRVKKIPKNKIIYIPNCPELEKIKGAESSAREKYSWKNKFVVLYAGEHGPSHDLYQIINVANLFKNNKNILFVMAGEGMEKNKLKKEAAKLNLKNIQFLNPVPKKEVFSLIKSVDVCTAVLNPVLTTTYPTKILDYMACSKPVILPIAGSAKELIEKAEAGIFSEPRNAKEFKKAVLFLYNNPQIARKYGKNGQEFIKNHFDENYVFGEKYLNEIIKRAAR